MILSNYDLAVAYRVYPKISKAPPFPFKNKLELVELCLKSFKLALGSLKTKMWVLLDNCPPEYTTLFQNNFPDCDLEIINLSGIGNLPTFQKQIEILSSQKASEVVYFAEDDYLYVPNQIDRLVKFLKKNPDCFVTPYDHFNYYHFDLYQHKNSIQLFENRHFRTGFSTCLTFLTNQQTLRKTRKIFESYVKGNHDASVWFCLTKPPILNPFQFIWHPIRNSFWLPIIAKAWRYCFFQVLMGRRWCLWVPIPAVATHLDQAFIAPAVDWKMILNTLK